MARFVIMDDSTFQRRVVCNAVKREGHVVIEATNGYEGLFKIATFWPDCALVDLVIPHMDGFTVLETIQKKEFPVPVIIITADVQATTREKCRVLGATAFINEPVDEKQVIDTIREVLAAWELSHPNNLDLV